MVHLKPVSIPRRIDPGPPKATLKQIPIAKTELLDIEPQRHRQRQSTLPRSAITHWLRADVQIVRCDLHVLSKPKREPRTDTLINRVTDIAAETKSPENVEIDILRHRHRYLHIRPELIVGLIDDLRGRDAT